MTGKTKYDVVVVGAGPNGLAAAIHCAETGYSVLLIEANAAIGGGARSEALTLEGFLHDTCSAVHPLGVASPYFRGLPLAEHGLEWITPPVCVAHPFDDGVAAALFPSIAETAKTLGEDGDAYRKRMEPLSRNRDALCEEILQPLHFPKHPVLLTRFGLSAVRSAESLCRSWFRGREARGLFAGLAAHSFLPLSQSPSSAIGLVLALAGHGQGWPIPRGGSRKITQALASYLTSLGGEIITGMRIGSAEELPPSRIVLFDVIPRTLVSIAGEKLPAGYRRKLEKFRHGPAAFKMDFALSAPIPWTAKTCAQAGTVHLGGTLEELAVAEQAPWDGKIAEAPYVLVSQPTLFDATRAPAGKHIAWAYCHVPRGSAESAVQKIERQIERFAPGFRDCILQRQVTTPIDLERHNANYFGGDISAGLADLRQAFFRPVMKWNPYAIPVKGWYFCSASTPPGAGVHGMCGYHAARRALESEG